MLRIGHGFDAHRFSDDEHRRLMLGGVCVRAHHGLVGHSDADAVMHATTDAILGALGLADIGSHFDDKDPQWHNADSAQFLEFAVAKAREEGWEIQNVDCTLLAEVPKIAPFREAIIENMTAVCGAQFNLKATRAEAMGAIGRKEGVACWAVVLLTKSDSPSGGSSHSRWKGFGH